eukprot:2047894-Alexandrium_andersonii.AAC.1
MLAGRLRHRRAGGAARWTERMATGLDAVLRSRAQPWAKFVALDALEYIQNDLVDAHPGAARDGRGADGRAQLFD